MSAVTFEDGRAVHGQVSTVFAKEASMNQVLRTVMERVRSTRVEEESARAAAAKAKADREEAERALGPAQREANALSAANARQARQRLKALEMLLSEAKAMEAADHSVPTPNMRMRARMLLVGGTSTSDEPYSAASAVTSIASLDRVAGAYLNCSQTTGKLMTWLNEIDLEDEGLYREADQLECQAWAHLKCRVVRLAGEDSI